MKTFKRFLASLMVAVMVLTAAPLNGFVGLELKLNWPNFDWLDFTPKASAASYSGTCGDNLTWTLNTSTGELVISGTGAMYDYTIYYNYFNYAPWYDYYELVEKVTIGDGVTSIGEAAFYYCKNLVSVTGGESVVKISKWAFYECENLTSISLFEGLRTIGPYAFENCYKLADITLPNSVASIGDHAFSWCQSIKSIVIPKSLTVINSSVFGRCEGLESLIIHDDVTTIASAAFNYCLSLTSVTIPDGVTEIGLGAFSHCDKLTEVTMPISAKLGNFSTSTSFGGSENIKKITLTKGNGAVQNYTNIWSSDTYDTQDTYYGFTPWYEHNVENVIVAEGVTGIGSYMFYDSNIESITLPIDITELGTNSFSKTTKLKDIYYKGSKHQLGCLVNESSSELDLSAVTVHYDLPNNFDDHTFVFYETVYENCETNCYNEYRCKCGEQYTEAIPAKGHSYTSVVVPPTPTEDGYTIHTCHNCNYSYTSDIVPAIGFTGICGDNAVWTFEPLTGELIISGTGDMYDYAPDTDAPWSVYSTQIKKVTIENGVTSIGDYAFAYCQSIESATIPGTVTHIGDNAFSNCTNLKSVTIESGVQSIGEYAFDYCENLVSVTIPGTVTDIGTGAFFRSGIISVTIESGAQNIGDYAFAYCTGFMSVTIESGVQNIGDFAFVGCTKLAEIVIPGSVSGVGNCAFWKCTGLVSVTIENGVKRIGSSAFKGCTGITDIIIPDSVTSIDSSAFGNCTNLASVTLPAGVTSLGYDAFENTPSLRDIYFKGNPHQWKCLINKYPGSLDIENITVHYGDSDSFDDHTFKLKSTIKETCTEKGQKEYSCACGEQYTEEISAKGHSYSSTVVAPTCTDGGYTVHTCTDCGDSYTDTDTEIIEHQYNSVVVKPNCTSGGYTIHTCTACGDSYKDSETEPSGHDYYQTVVVPTCKDGGYTVNTCRYCDDTYVSDEKGPAGHQYTSVVISPTCLNEGYTLGACNVCGASSISDKKPALGHEYIEQVTPPTCESEGYTTFTCTRGDHIYIDNRVAASGHDYEQTVFAPTCIQDGCTFNICNDCGRLHKSDVVAATGHSFGSWRTVISPAENKEGLEERYCKYCGYTEERTLPMTQRTAYTATFVADGKKVATIEFLKGTTSIEEPPVPHKDRYNGEWEDYTLGNADIVINAKYQPVALNNLSGISNNKTASYDASTGIASVTLTASSDAKTVITQSKERVPLDIVLVVDQSGSMNSNLGGRYSKKDSLIDSTYEFVDMVYEDALTNGIDHKIAIVGFGMGSKSSGAEYPAFLNTEILTTGRRPLGVQYATKEDYKNALMSVNQNGALNGGITTAINSIDANGATAADYGLSMASSIFANNPIEAGENRQRIVIFISDGEPTYSSGFEVDVANAAIQQAHQLKNTHNATIYSVGVMTDAEAKSEKLNAFLARVSSDYMDARNIFGNADRVSESFSINVDDTDNLSAMFSDIVTENVTQTTDFDSVTVIDTVSKYFTLTSQQEKALRYSLISEYGVKNSDIEIIRNEDGTTSIKISNIKTKPVETDGKVKYTVTINYEVSANENAATAGTYPICTDDSGIIIDGNDCYERTFPVPTAEITENRNTVVFKVNGEVYAIKSVTPGSKVTVPETDFIGEYEFSGWDVPKGFVSDETLSEFDSVLIRPEYVIIWNTESGTEKVTYSPGDIIDEPEVSPNANGEAFRRWNGTVPVQMPAESLEFTAVYGDHEHQYYTETTKEMTCLEDGEVKHICSVCNDSYTETVKTPGEHSWKAIAKPGSKDNTSSAYFECERCGICADKQLNYVITENEPNERGHFESLTHEFNYVDEEGNLYQPDGNIEIVTTVSDYFEGADSVNVYRIDENGNKVKCNSEYDNGVLTFETNHFSTYVFEPYYSCQSTGEHGDENGDGYCDRCDSVLKEFIDFIIKEGIDAQIDSDNHILLGNDVLNYSVEEIAGLFEFGNIYIEGKESGRIGTGDVICLTNDSGEVCNRLTAVIFGDVNGDGWYDGMDAVLVSCLANGMLTKDDVSEAVYMAADCNHDGVIDQLDVDLLNEAGTLLANVDQSKPAEVLLETSSEYVEYISLIDQSFEIEDVETEDIPEADAEETPEADTDVESEDTTPEQDAKVDIFEMIMNFIKSIFEMLLSYIPMPIK